MCYREDGGAAKWGDAAPVSAGLEERGVHDA